MKNVKLTTLICGLISIATTVIFYLLTFDNIFTIPTRWISLLFLLIAEIVGTLKALFVENNIIAQASIFTSIAHLVAVLTISIVFVNLFPLALKTFILLNILLMCVLAAIDLLISHFGKSVSESDKKSIQSQGVLNACYEKAQSLVTVYGYSDYKKDLNEIAELIKYSDNSELTGDECSIMDKLGNLESQLKESTPSIPTLISEIKNLINLRTIKIKSIKKGGY